MLSPWKKSYDKPRQQLKCKNITLPTKVCLVKAIVFPVVMYGCESWTTKKAWVPNNWCIWTVVLEKTLESSLDCKEIQPVNLKGNQSWKVIGMTNAEAEAPILWLMMQRTDSLEKPLMLGKVEGRRIRGQWRMRCVDSITDGQEFDQALQELGNGHGSHRLAKTWTWLRYWTNSLTKGTSARIRQNS